MVKDRVAEAVEFLAQCLEESSLEFSKIIVFGSQAKGIATEESDIDVVIISDDFREKDIFDRATLTKDAEIKTIKKFMLPLDIITMTPEEWEKGNSLITELAKGGEAVYER